jgi:hypothetical protein
MFTNDIFKTSTRVCLKKRVAHTRAHTRMRAHASEHTHATAHIHTRKVLLPITYYALRAILSIYSRYARSYVYGTGPSECVCNICRLAAYKGQADGPTDIRT